MSTGKGTVYRPTYTKTVPDRAEIISKGGLEFAKVKPTSGGRAELFPVKQRQDGSLRMLVRSGTYIAKFRDAEGIVQRKRTGCRDKDAALSVLGELKRKVELVKSGVMTRDEQNVADHQATCFAEHMEAYIRSLKVAGRSIRHMSDTKRLAKRIAGDCGFRTLRDIEASKVVTWLSNKLDAGMAARTRNSYLQALNGLCSWCVKNQRLMSNPVRNIDRADVESDRRLVRRALFEEELQRLLFVTSVRPLAEMGRETIRKPADKVTGKRDTWKRALLTFETIEAAVERARERLAGKPDRIAELEATGRERALVFKTLLLTGLRSDELRSLTVGQIHLDGPMPYIELEARDEKNRDGSDLPLRADLAEDIRGWLGSRQKPSTLRIDGSESLPLDAPLFYVPTGLLRILDRDLRAAGIAKTDDRGRTIDVHAMRHTFGTMLSQNGVQPRTAQEAMRHSKIDLTMNIYTDPRLLDVAGAMNALPSFPLNTSPRSPESSRATGTTGALDSSLVPVLVPNSGKQSPGQSIPVTLGKMTETQVGKPVRPENSENPTKKASLPNFGNEALQRPRRDLNPQPPDRQSGALTN
jgi:integrase